MKIGVIADDFTGASDIALTLAEAGMKTAQFIGVPSGAVDEALDAGVVALKSRTAPVGEAVAQSLEACRWFRSRGVEQIIFKVCSTFDSTPEGNIGPVLDALAGEMGATQTLVCPAFPENGRTVFMGHLFVGDRLLNESGMQDHPLTPMTDPDLRRWLAAQSRMSVGHVPAAVIRKGTAALEAALRDIDGHVILDAVGDEDLMTIGAAASGAALLCGGSGIALGLPRNFGINPSVPDWQPVTGRAVVLSGSCSRATRAQVAVYRKLGPALEIGVDEVISGAVDADSVAAWVLDQETTPLVYSSADPEVVRDAQERHGLERSAHAIEGLFSSLAARLAESGITRMVVAGGETSGAVVSGLGADVLAIGPRVTAGVPLLLTGREGSPPLALALKSGNFGEEDFFSLALERMEQPR
jgi:uncharacterized protein YgbK (DUF1537 family)